MLNFSRKVETNKQQKKIFNFRPIFYGFLALLLSISTAKFLFAGELKIIIFDVLIFVFLLLYIVFSRKFVSFLIVICFFALGLGLFPLGIYLSQGQTFEGTHHVVGRVSDNISISSYGNKATVVLEDVFIDGKADKNLSLSISINQPDDIKVGDIVAFLSEIEKAKLFELGDFNSFYYRDRVAYVAEISLKDLQFQGNRLSADESFRLKVKQCLIENMGQNEGTLAYATLFGDKSELDDKIYDAFNSAGIVHLLAVSGLHVTFLFALFGWILKKLHINRFFNLLICATILGVYAWLCNFTPSVLRAGIMGIVLMFCKTSGKCYDPLNSLGLAGILILLISPLFAYDLGFLLSFSCVLSIYLLSPFLTKIFCKIFPKFVAGAFAVSISVQLGVLPFLSKMFAEFNFLSPFVNLLVIPLFSLIYPLLFILAPLVAGMPFLGFFLKLPQWGFVAITCIASFFGQTQFKILLKPFGIFFVGAFFVLLFLISGFFMCKKRTKVIVCSTVFLISTILFGCSYIEIPTKETLSYCFNYSNSCVILTDNKGECALVDLGSYDFTMQALSRIGLRSVSTLFVLQDNSIDIETSRDIGISNIIRATTAQGFEEEQVVGTNKTYIYGNFAFQYKTKGSRLLGLEIDFCGKKVFVMRDWSLSVSALQELGASDFDYVILGKHDEYAEYFSSRSKILTHNKNILATTSFVRNGNVCYNLKGNWRCLD